MENIRLIIWDLDETFWKGTLSETTISIPEKNIEIINKIFNRKCEMNNKRSNKNSLSKSSSHCLMFSGPNISTSPNPFKQIINENFFSRC